VQVDLGGGRRSVEGQPLFLAVPRALMSSEDPVTADLSRAVNFGAAGHLVAKPPAGVTFTPLAEATPQAALVSADLAMTDPDPRAVMEAYSPAEAPSILAGRISGDLRSLFATPPPVPAQPDPDRAAREAEERAGVEPFVSRSETPAEIILIADADMLDDGFFLNPDTGAPIADNAAFVLNALDNLGGDEALMALRSRAPAARPMERVDEMRAKARDRLYKEQERLEALLAEAESHLRQIERRRVAGAVRTPDELAQMASFREQANQIRRQLRGVEREFRRDIDALAGRLELINIWLPPIFAGALGAGLFLWRSKRRPDQGSGGRP
jgi:ABC-2 type transport system permease protein